MCLLLGCNGCCMSLLLPCLMPFRVSFAPVIPVWLSCQVLVGLVWNFRRHQYCCIGCSISIALWEASFLPFPPRYVRCLLWTCCWLLSSLFIGSHWLFLHSCFPFFSHLFHRVECRLPDFWLGHIVGIISDTVVPVLLVMECCTTSASPALSWWFCSTGISKSTVYWACQ